MVKAQYFSFDALIAALIFLLGLMTFYSYWQYYNTEGAHSIELLRKEAMRISNLLFSNISEPYGILSEETTNLINLSDLNQRAEIASKIENLSKTSPYCIIVRDIYNHFGEDSCNMGQKLKYTLYRPAIEEVRVNGINTHIKTLLIITIYKPSSTGS